MKKYLALILGVLFVLSFAASAFAIHAEIPSETQAVVAAGGTQITLGGEIRTRGWYRDHYSGGLGTGAEEAAWWDERVRLSIDAKVTPNVEGFVQIETHSDASGDKYVWGSGGTLGVGKNSAGAGGTNSKPAAYFDILQAWIQYSGQGLFGFPAGFKIGHMPLKLAYGQFFDNTQYGDDALVLFMAPVKGLEIAALTFKGYEGATSDNHDDLDAYVGLATYKWNDKNTVGVNYTYLNSNSILGPQTDLKMQNASLHADGNIAGLGYKVAGDYQFGSVADGDVDFKGWAVSAYLNYDFNTMNVPLNVRGSFVMGSGEKDATDDNLKEFIPFVGNIQNYSFIYEYMATTTAFNKSGLNTATPSDGHAPGVANTTYFNLGLDWNATKTLTLSVDGYLFYATETGAWEDATGNNVSDSAGWEVDAKLKYALAKNLTYQIDLGYFDPGSFYEDAYGLNNPSGVTQLRNMLTLSF